MLAAGLAVLLLAAGCGSQTGLSNTSPAGEETTMLLPEPSLDGEVSLEQALAGRRSVREYAGTPLTLDEVSQLLWAAQGVTSDQGWRTAPSAGGTYPLELYVFAGDVQGLKPGCYRYLTDGHRLAQTIAGDLQDELTEASLDQEWVRSAAAVFIFTVVYERTTERYGERGIRYVHMELGHAAQNLCLQATALGLGAVTIGAFHDDRISALLDLPETEAPLYVIPVGRKP